MRKISNTIHHDGFRCSRRELAVRGIDYLYLGCDITSKVIEIQRHNLIRDFFCNVFDDVDLFTVELF